jgi:hypothetical protein
VPSFDKVASDAPRRSGPREIRIDSRPADLAGKQIVLVLAQDKRPIGSAFLLGNLDESVGGETKNPGVIGGPHAARNAECLDHGYNCIHQTAMFARDVS